jgi:nicotinamide-nucleotide amidase
LPETLAPALPDALDQRTVALLQEVCRQELTLATAESCTGGLLASLFTDVTGCGHAFERGFVTYTDESKHELLGVPKTLLDDPGAVSEVVARAMAEGAIERSRADIALAVTGYAGAGGPDAVPGLVHFASARRGGPTLHRVRRFQETDRAGVRLRCVEVALDMIGERLDGAFGDAAYAARMPVEL